MVHDHFSGVRSDEEHVAVPSTPTLCSDFVRALPVTGASISLFGAEGDQSTICATDSMAARAEALQFELGEGPHWEALHTGAPVLCPDLAASGQQEWPVFRLAARDLGVAAMFSFPMTMGAVVVGVVDLYRATVGAMAPSSVAMAGAMASRAAGAAALEAVRSAGDDRTSERETAPALRREVHQATGVILSQLDIPATEAFARLRAYAFASGRPVEDVAHDVVGGRLDLSTSPD